MTLERFAWLFTVAIGLIGAVLFLLSGFRGYGTLAALLALAASVNLVGDADAREPGAGPRG